MGLFDKFRKKTEVKGHKGLAYNDLSRWLDSVFAEIIPDDVAGIVFNLYQDAENQWALEVVGTSSFDDADDNWACDEITDFDTRKKPFSWKDESGWKEVLSETKIGLCKYLEDGQQSEIIKTVQGVSVGFVDGDLEMLYIAEISGCSTPIRDLQRKLVVNDTTWREGNVRCKLWDKDIGVTLDSDDVTLDYARKCVEAMNNMPQDLIDDICRAAIIYCNTFRDDIGDMLEDDMTVPIDENSTNDEIMKCFSPESLIIEAPKDASLAGYQLCCNCDWEIEHGMEIDILDNKLVYLSSYDGNSPWVEQNEDEWWNYALNA